MNRKIFFISAALFFALFSGCNNTETKEAQAIEWLDINRQYLSFNEGEGYGFFDINSNAKWTVSCSDAWLTPSLEEGEGNELIRLSVTVNNSTDARTGTLLVTTEGGKTKTVHVTQGEKEVSIMMLPSAGVIGRKITLTGLNFDLIEEMWFGNAKGAILDGRTNGAMTVTIPETAERNKVDLKYIYDNGKERIAGVINLFTRDEVEPKITIPPRLIKCAGEDVTFPCTFPNEVVELWFGSVKGVIKRAIGDNLIVTIPAGTPQNVCEVKVVYDEGDQEKNIGKFSIALDAGDYYLWKNITIYSQTYPVAEKVFCLETGMMVSECWIKDNMILINKNHPELAFSDGDNQPRGYHHLMLYGTNDRMRIISPNTSNTTIFSCSGTPLTSLGLPPLRSVRIDKEPYRQNTAYPASHGGNSLYTPGADQIACYNGVKDGRLTVAQWNAATDELAVNPPATAAVATVGGVANTISVGTSFIADMSILPDGYTSTAINAAGGTVGGGIYYYNLAELRVSAQNSFQGGGVVLWTSSYASSNTINNAQNRQLNGALELVSYTHATPGTSSCSLTMNVMRKKAYNETFYSYDPTL